MVSENAPYFIANNTNVNANTNANTAVIMAPSLTPQTTMYPYTSTTNNGNNGQDGQVLGTLLLSPIKEMDSSSSNNTLIPGHPNTTALAQAVLPTNLANCK